MPITVFANGMSIACKAASGQTAAAMPDVCLSPPTPPAGPVPIPYPNTATASDTDGGSTTVMISGEMVMLKDQATFKKSTGNEAATKSLPMGVVTACLTGEASFVAWSMDVKFEDQNVPRHMDIMLHNEQCSPANTPPWPYIDSMAVGLDPCAAEKAKEEAACKGDEDPCKDAQSIPSTKEGSGALAAKVRQNPCLVARKCKLQPFNQTGKGKTGCCPGQTGHHLVPKASFQPASDFKSYKQSQAPCICVEGSNHGHGTHGAMHTVQSYSALKTPNKSLSATQKSAAGAVRAVFPESGCSSGCLTAQLAAYHETKAGISPDAELDPPTTNKPSTEKVRQVIALARIG